MSAPPSQPFARGAVFLSYASQDAAAARRICDALRAAGVEVWFDQNELVGGDAWDAKIRKQIAECALFVPIISAATQARTEGYFRLEWKLAAQRTHMIADDAAFLLPVVIDETRDSDARVPAEFKAVQWTRLPGGEAGEALGARVDKLLGGRAGPPPAAVTTASGLKQRAAPPVARARPRRLVPVLAAIGALAAAGGWWLLERPAVGPAAVTSRDASPPPASAPVSEANRLVAKAWEQMDKTEMARNELLLAEGFCKQATALEETNPAVWAAWSAMNTWYCFHGFELLPARKEAARDYAQKALAIDPKSYEARYAWAHFVVRLAVNQGEEKAAIPVLRELLRERPDEPRALYDLGFGLVADLATMDEGFGLLERLAEKYPWFAGRALNELGWTALFQGRYATAESAAERAVKAQPYWNNLGLKATLALRLRGDVALAQTMVDRLPPSALQENWGIALAVMVADWRGDYQRAVSLLQSVSRDWLENFFFGGPTSFLSGWMRLKAKQATAAEKDFRRALELIAPRLEKSPNDPVLLYYKAEAQRLLGMREEADRTYRQACEVWPRTFAQVTFESPDGALAYVRQMVERGPSIDYFPASWWFTAASLRHDPTLENVRRATGFAALLKEVEAQEKQRWTAPPATGAKTGAMPASPVSAPAKSVAVLAFRNLSGDPKREFFSDGLSEAVTDVLGRVPGLKVVGSASAFSFKGKSVPIPEIARQLGVTHLVDGTVIQDGSTVRITAKLIQADGFQMWVSDKIESDAKSIFALHDEVAGLIAKNLSLKLGASSAGATAAVNPQAYELYMQGRQAWNQRTSKGYDLAESLLNRALALEPNFARAHAALADVWVGRMNITRRTSEAEAPPSSDELKRSKEKIARALALDPDSAEAHASLGGLLYAVEGKYSEADSALRRALGLNPNYAPAHQWFSSVQLYRGKMDEALEHSRLATELDPLSPRILTNHGTLLNFAGRPADALSALERALTLQPNFYQALRWKGLALVELGRLTEAVAQVKRLPSEDARTPAIQLFVLARSGLKVEAEAILADSRSHARNPIELPVSLLALGRAEEAMALLTPKALNLRASYLWDPIFDPLRQDPRWVKLISDSGLTEAHARAQAWRKAHPPEKPAK